MSGEAGRKGRRGDREGGGEGRVWCRRDDGREDALDIDITGLKQHRDN